MTPPIEIELSRDGRTTEAGLQRIRAALHGNTLALETNERATLAVANRNVGTWYPRRVFGPLRVAFAWIARPRDKLSAGVQLFGFRFFSLF